MPKKKSKEKIPDRECSPPPSPPTEPHQLHQDTPSKRASTEAFVKRAKEFWKKKMEESLRERMEKEALLNRGMAQPEGNAVPAQPMDLEAEMGHKQLAAGLKENGDDREVKKEADEGGEGGLPAKVQGNEASKREGASGGKRKARKGKPPLVTIKEEEMEEEGFGGGAVPSKEVKVEEEMPDGGDATKETPTGVENEAAKRKEMEISRGEGATRDVVEARNGQPSGVVVKEEEGSGESAVPSEQVRVEEEGPAVQMEEGGTFWGGEERLQVDPEPVMRGIDIFDEIIPNEGDFLQNEADPYPHNDFGDQDDDLGGVEPPPGEAGESEPNDGIGQRNDEDVSEEEEDEQVEKRRKSGRVVKPRKVFGDAADFGGGRQGKRKRCQTEEKKEKSAKRRNTRVASKQSDEAETFDGEGEGIEKPAKRRRRSLRLTNLVNYTVERDSDDETSDEDGEDSEEEERERLCQRTVSDAEAADEDHHNEEMVDQADSVDDGNDQKKCPVAGCTEKVGSSEDLLKHMRKHPKPLVCRVCERSFPSGPHLRRHCMRHTGEKPFKCGICQKMFALKGTLLTHQRTHTGDRPYKCNTCDHQATTSSSLKKHQRSHTGEKPYPCTVCGRHFSRSHHLIAHTRSHTGERPYACDMCDYKAAQRDDLRKHERTHTKEKPYCCPCGLRTITASNLARHKKTFSN